jgi:COP9 signalosome complex subunit 1
VSTVVCHAANDESLALPLISALEKEIAGLIMDSKVQARIDSHRKILFARHTDVRGQTYTQVLEEGEAYLRESKVCNLCRMTWE